MFRDLTMISFKILFMAVPMDIAVGIGGAVMEDEGGLTLIAGHHLLVEVLGIHGLQHIRLPLGQCGPHGKVGLGKVDGVVVIHGNFSFI
jgi:hypothetical protein